MTSFSFKRLYNGATSIGAKYRNLTKTNIEKTKCYNSIMLLDDSALPGDVNDTKRLSGPTDSLSLTIKRNSSCKSIIFDNNEEHKCNPEKNSMKYIMCKNKQATAPSSFKLELPTAHLEKPR
jgi:hypothetical protein